MKCQLIELRKPHPVACIKINLQHYFCCDFPQVCLWLSSDSAHCHSCSQQAIRRKPSCASGPSSRKMVGDQTYPDCPYWRLWHHWISRRRICQQSHGIYSEHYWVNSLTSCGNFAPGISIEKLESYLLITCKRMIINKLTLNKFHLESWTLHQIKCK